MRSGYLGQEGLETDHQVKEVTMTQLGRCLLSAGVGVAILGGLSGCIADGMDPGSPRVGSGLEFAEARLILEHNATDGDAEIVVFVKGGDEGLASLKVYAPDGSVVVAVSTQDRVVGLREFAVESAEPGVAQVLRAYPEGSYRIEGVTIGGDRLHASARLSHKLPSPPKLKVNTAAGTVTWSAAPGAVTYSLELEREVDGEDEMKLTMELPAAVRSLSIPKAFSVAGDYQVGIAAHGANGNIIVVEQEFSIEE